MHVYIYIYMIVTYVVRWFLLSHVDYINMYHVCWDVCLDDLGFSKLCCGAKPVASRY